MDFEVPAWRPKPELIAGDRRALAEWSDVRHADVNRAEARSAEADLNRPAARSLEEEALYIAELDDAPAGCAYLVTLVDYFNQRPHAHLSVLAVAKHAEGKGVGSALLDQCVAWAKERNSDRLTLSALVANSRARGLYERKGFGGEYIRYVLPL